MRASQGARELRLQPAGQRLANLASLEFEGSGKGIGFELYERLRFRSSRQSRQVRTRLMRGHHPRHRPRAVLLPTAPLCI